MSWLKAFECPYGVAQVREADRSVKVAVTVWWLVCPRLKRAASRIEAASFIAEIEKEITADNKWFEVEYEDFLYARARHILFRRILPYSNNWLRGGVGGRLGGVKCLHAEIAFFLATGFSFVLEYAQERLRLLDRIKEEFDRLESVCRKCLELPSRKVGK